MGSKCGEESIPLENTGVSSEAGDEKPVPIEPDNLCVTVTVKCARLKCLVFVIVTVTVIVVIGVVIGIVIALKNEDDCDPRNGSK